LLDELLRGPDKQGSVERLEDKFEAVKREFGAAGEDTAQVSRIDATVFAEAVA